MLVIEQTGLILIDIQEKLFRVMHEREALQKNLEILIRGAKILGLPICWVEQNPKGLGPTIQTLSSLLTSQTPIVKNTFSCCGNTAFMESWKQTGRSAALIGGIESHICVYQTAADLHTCGVHVQVCQDAVSSRRSENKNTAISRMRTEGITITSVEMALFELMKVAEGPVFKKMLPLFK